MAKFSETRTSQPRPWRNQQGLTLIGVLVAVVVFSIMLIAVSQLMARSEKTIGISREEFIATNLAREGLELAQYVRDSNWLSRGHTQADGTVNPPDHPWTDHPHSGATLGLCNAGNPIRDYTIFSGTSIGVSISTTNIANFIITPNGHYTSPGVSGATGTPSVFSRTININCVNQGNIDPTNPDQREHIIVTSRVWWTSRGEPKEVTLSTRLYNWYQ